MKKLLLASVIASLSLSANAEVQTYTFTGEISIVKNDTLLTVPDGELNSQSLLGTNVTGKILVDIDKIPDDILYPDSTSYRNNYSNRDVSPGILSMSVTIDETGQSFSIPMHDEVNSNFSPIDFLTSIDIENDHRSTNDKTNFHRKTTYGEDTANNTSKTFRLNSAGAEHRNSTDIKEPFYLDFGSELPLYRSYFTLAKRVNKRITQSVSLYWDVKTLELDASCN